MKVHVCIIIVCCRSLNIPIILFAVHKYRYIFVYTCMCGCMYACECACIEYVTRSRNRDQVAQFNFTV